MYQTRFWKLFVVGCRRWSGQSIGGDVTILVQFHLFFRPFVVGILIFGFDFGGLYCRGLQASVLIPVWALFFFLVPFLGFRWVLWILPDPVAMSPISMKKSGVGRSFSSRNKGSSAKKVIDAAYLAGPGFEKVGFLEMTLPRASPLKKPDMEDSESVEENFTTTHLRRTIVESVTFLPYAGSGGVSSYRPQRDLQFFLHLSIAGCLR